jgi:hypothetical protein
MTHNLSKDLLHFKSTTYRHLNTLCENFIFWIVFVSMFCIFYDFFHILLSFWPTSGSMECVCVYIHTHKPSMDQVYINDLMNPPSWSAAIIYVVHWFWWTLKMYNKGARNQFTLFQNCCFSEIKIFSFIKCNKYAPQHMKFNNF